MTKKFLSLIIVPHSKSKFKTITLSIKAIKVMMGSSAFLFVLLVVFLVDYFSMNVTRQKYRELLSENQKQQETISGLKGTVGILKKTVESFESYARKLNIMAGLKSPDVLKEVGVGDGELSASIVPGESATPPQPAQTVSLGDLKSLNQKAENIEKNLNTLVGFFETQSAKLASTPTIWPTVGWMTSPFGWRDDPFTGKNSFHYGIDIATNLGNPIVATADGIVVSLKNEKIDGRTLVLSHGGGITTYYLHLDKFLVKSGQRVKRGDIIGLVGKTGKALGPHVHYEVRINNKPVNPYQYILEE